MGIIKARQLVHEYIRRDEEGNVESISTALDHVDLDVEAGDFIAILGHNGSGKSTLAKHLNALLLPTEGKVLVDGMDTADEADTLSIRQRVGMVFQNPDNQLVTTIVEEDVAFGPENIGVPGNEIRARVDRALAAVGMEKYAHSAPNMLSGGQKQRIAIAGMLAMQPKVLVLDEATAMLDPKGRRDIIDLVTKLHKENGITVVMITQYMEEAIGADRVAVMSGGELILEGTPKEVFSQDELLHKHRLDVPVMQQLANRLNAHGANLPKSILSVEEMAQAICLSLSKN